jgi:hypothetical protein
MERCIELAIELANERAASDFTFGNMLAVIAMSHLGGGDVASGHRYAESAVEHARRSRCPSTIVMATFALGWSLIDDDAATAIEHLTHTIELCRDGAIDAVYAPALLHRASLRLSLDQPADAVADLRRGFLHSVEIADELTIGGGAVIASSAMARADRPDVAAVMFGIIDAEVMPNYWGGGRGARQVDELRDELLARLVESEYRAAHAHGASMSYDEAVAYIGHTLNDLQAELAASA